MPRSGTKKGFEDHKNENTGNFNLSTILRLNSTLREKGKAKVSKKKRLTKKLNSTPLNQKKESKPKSNRVKRKRK